MDSLKSSSFSKYLYYPLNNFSGFNFSNNKYFYESTSLSEYHKIHKTLSVEAAKIVSLYLAGLHLTTVHSDEFQKLYSDPNFNSFRKLNSSLNPIFKLLNTNLSPENLKKIPVQSWRFIGIYQKSVTIKNIVENLVFNSKEYCLTYNKLNFCKIFASNNFNLSIESNTVPIRFVDWNVCSWGDPASDLGTAISEYFILWLSSMLFNPTLELKTSMRTATISLDFVLSSINNLVNYYLDNTSNILKRDSDFLLRSIRFAGLAIIYNLLEDFHDLNKNAVDYQLGYFQIASQLLSKPEKFIKN